MSTTPTPIAPDAGQSERRRSRRRAASRTRLRHAGTNLLALLVVLALWWAVTAAQLVKPLFLPSPQSVARAFHEASSCRPVSPGAKRVVCGEQGYFLWEHLVASLERIGIGVAGGIVVGVLLGFAMALVPWIGRVLEPYLSFLRSLPPLGYIGLLIVWFGIGDASKIWLLFLAAFPPIALATIDGVRGVRTDRIHAVQSLGASRRQVLWHVIVPASLPSILGGVRIATGFAWTTVVAAELNNGIPGIGGLAYLAGTQLQTPLTIACIIVIGVAAIVLDTAITWLMRADALAGTRMSTHRPARRPVHTPPIPRRLSMAAPDGVRPARTPRRRPATPRSGTAPAARLVVAVSVVAGVLAATGLTGCSTAREAEARANASLGAATCPVAADDQFTGTIRIGYQAIPNANLLVKDRGWLEACLPHAQVKWMEFDSGGDVVQAFGARSIDIATLGSSPVTKALSAPLNLDVRVVWIDDVIGRAESLVARDASVHSLRQLKGRTITTPFGSTSHYSLLQALAMNGMQASDVKLVNLSPDKMMAAWQNRQVDAAWVWDPVLSQLTSTGHVVTGSDATAAAGHPTFDLEGATGQFVAANPAVMDTWTAVENHAVQQMSSDREGAVESLAVQLGAAPATVRKQVTGYTYPTARQQVVLDRALPQQLLATAQFLRTQGSIDAVSAPAVYARGVSTSYIQKVGS